MRLKEFDLDLPNANRETRHRFRLETRCMTALYERCFPGLTVEGAWKVLIECVDAVDRPEPRNLLGVLTLQAAFDHRLFWEGDSSERKRMALGVLHTGTLIVAAAQHWPPEPFNAANNCVVERGYKNEWTWPKSRLSPDKKHRALVSCSHEPDRFRAWLVVQDRLGKELQRRLVIDEAPDEFLFVPKMGKLVWESAERIVLLDAKGEEVGSVSPGAPVKQP